MKKKAMMLVAAMLVCSLCGCEQSQEAVTPNVTSSVAAEAVQEEITEEVPVVTQAPEEQQPEETSEVKEEVKEEPKGEIKTEPKEEVPVVTQAPEEQQPIEASEVKEEVKEESKQEAPEVSETSEVKEEVKEEPKEEIKTEPKEEAPEVTTTLAEQQPEEASEVKEEVKEEPKQEVSEIPEVKEEVKEEPKEEIKTEPKEEAPEVTTTLAEQQPIEASEVKEEVKEESKEEAPEVSETSEVKEEVKEEPKEEIKTEPKEEAPEVTTTPAEQQPEETPEVKEEIKEEPKQEAHVHNWVKVSETASTCETKGSVIYRCECGEPKIEELPFGVHTPEEFWEDIKAATCQEKGEEGKRCSRCREFVETRETEKVAHRRASEEKILNPTCMNDGYIRWYCRYCDFLMEETVFEKTGHQYDIVSTTQPTCCTQGSYNMECIYGCGETTKTVIPADRTKHDFSVLLTDAPENRETTCTLYGIQMYGCSAEGCTATERQITQAPGHVMGEWIVDEEPECYGTGSKHRVCTVCGENREEQAIYSTSHTLEVTQVIPPSCAGEGYSIKGCTKCSYEEMGDWVAATGVHEEGTWVVVEEPTVGFNGRKDLMCSCGHVYDSEVLPMLETDGVDQMYAITLDNGETVYVTGHFDYEGAQETFDLVNEYRVSQGYSALEQSQMDEYTAQRAIESSYVWDHVRPDGAGVIYNENLGMLPPTNTELTTSEAVVNAWIASEGHESNLLYGTEEETNYGSVAVFCKKVKVENENNYYVYEKYYVQTYTYLN